ncbi:hypothetical protein [Blastococcus sp. SYSU DS0617]
MTASCTGGSHTAPGAGVTRPGGIGGPAITPALRAADVVLMMLQTIVHAAARSRAHGPTAALWHAVELHRPMAEIDGACELTVCGSLARVVPDGPWPRTGDDVCPECSSLVR